jgi:hypothetical protein
MRFFDYTGFPPAFRKGCAAFLDAYNEDSVVEDRLVLGGSVEAQCKRCVRAGVWLERVLLADAGRCGWRSSRGRALLPAVPPPTHASL